jgi:putative spermidine/putrescine transport system ATP-binding protein
VGVALGGLRLDVAVDNPADFSCGATALFSVRPEKLQLRPRGQGRMDGEVQERFFLGSQWLYRLSTDAGDWTVLCPNDGRESLAVGDAAAIDWPDHCARLLPGEVPAAREASA